MCIKYYYEFVSVVSVSQHTKRMPHIILLSVACLALLYFSTLSHKRQDVRENFIEHKKVCFDFIYNFCLKYFSLTEDFSEILS
jgi:hypothetical protein